MIHIKETATKLHLTGDLKQIRAVGESLKFRPDGFWRSPKYQLWKDTDGKKGWDGFIRPMRQLINGGSVQRGHKEAIISFCTLEEIEVDTEEMLESPFVGLTIDDIPANVLPGFKSPLDDAQRGCILSLLHAAIGCVKMVVSSGKTATLLAAATIIKNAHPKCRILYIVPTERLVNQVTASAKEFQPTWSISQLGGGVKNFKGKDCVVATMASLNSNFEEIQEKWLKSFMVLIVDEAHHAQAPSYEKVLLEIPAFFRFGASDSLKNERESDIAAMMKIRGLLGPEKNSVGLELMLELGRVAKPHVYFVDQLDWHKKFDNLPHHAEPDTPAWALIDDEWRRCTYVGATNEDTEIITGVHQVELDGDVIEVESRHCILQRAYDMGVIKFKARNELICQWTKHFSDKGWPTLVIATRTPHVIILQSMLAQMGVEVAVLTGEDSTKMRDEVFAWLTSTPGAVLISPIVKEGVSLPELRAAVIADSIASPDLFRQIIGRVVRKKPTGDNSARIVTFVDRQLKSARTNCLKLVQEMESIRGMTYYYPCGGPKEIGEKFEAVEIT